MSDEMYLDGRGVMGRTRHLVDRMWDTLGVAFGGMCVAVIGASLPWAIFEGEFPVISSIASIVAICVGVIMARPWFKATAAVRRHTARMKAETAKRGKGWAAS